MRSTRVLIGIAAAAALLLLIAGSASAKTVYKYVYSGEYFDGSGSLKGQFKGLGGIDYEPATEKLYVSVPVRQGSSTSSTRTARLRNSAPSTTAPAATTSTSANRRAERSPSTNRTMRRTKGNIYISSRGAPSSDTTRTAWRSNRPSTRPSSAKRANRESASSAAAASTAGPNGEYWDFTFGNGQPEIHRRNLETFKAEVTFLTEGTFGRPIMCSMKVDSQGNFYGLREEGGFGPRRRSRCRLNRSPMAPGARPRSRPRGNGATDSTPSCCGQEVTAAIPATHIGDRPSDDKVFVVESQFVPETALSSLALRLQGGPADTFGEPEGGYQGLEELGGVTVDPVTHDVYVTNNRDYGGEVRHVEKFVRGPSFTVPDDGHRTADPAVNSTESAVLHGTVNPEGIETIACWFEYGLTQSLGSLVPCNEGMELSGSGDIDVTANISGLKKGRKYWVKVFSANANEVISDGGPEQFLAQSTPISNPVFVSKINTDGANFNATIDPNGGRTWYYWE